MRGVRAVLLAALLVGSVLAPVGAATAAGADAATGPAVTVSVGSTTVESGEYYERGAGPSLTVAAAVGADAPEGTRIDEIVVRANGERAASVSVDAPNVTEEVTPDFDEGNNTVRVIVTDTAGAVDATTFTLSVDGRPPSVFLRSPYETRPWYDIVDGKTTGSNATLSGEILDDSAVERLIVTHEYEGYSETETLREPGTNFSLPVFLGYNESGQSNEFRLTVTDEFDNTRVYEFNVDVRDGGGPTLALDPYVNETNRRSIDLSGTISDDVWIDEANVSVSHVDSNETRVTDIVTPREYERDPDRTSIDFETEVWFRDLGVHEVQINATDIDGNTVTETFTVERLSAQGQSPDPEIRIDRDRTVVLNDETLFLSGAVLEGRVDRVVVETRNAATGATLDYQTVHSGRTADRVVFDRQVGIGPGETTVIVRATDSEGGEHTTQFAVNGTARETFVGETDAETGPTVTVTPLSNDTPGEAASTVTVDGVTGGTLVAIPPEGGRPDVAATGNVSLTNLTVDAATNYTLGVTVRERASGPLPAPPETAAVGTAAIGHSVDDAAIDGVTLTFDVAPSYLDDHGVDPANVTAYRRSGGEWSTVESIRADGPSGSVRYTVDSPGLSTFALAVDDPPDPPDGNESDDGTGDDGTVDNGTADNGTASGDEPTGEPRISVENVTVNRTTAAPNEAVGIDATLHNSGDGNGTYTAALRTIHGGNASLESTRRVTVAAGGRANVSYTTRFADPGNYTVSVNGTRAGPIVVADATNGTTGNATGGNGTAGNGTADNGTADNGTASGGESAGSPQIFVENVTVNRTTAAPNETVRINATLRNSGDGNGTYTAALRTIEGLNTSLEATRRVTVAAGGRTNVSYTTRFADPGNYTVSVNGTQAGPVTVENGGGPLSVLAFVPLRLLGLGVGGLVGLVVVGVLVRFVLRRVGGSGEEASG